MKTFLETMAERYADWLNTSWSMLTGTPLPAQEPTPKAAQAAANQEWEQEGGRL